MVRVMSFFFLNMAGTPGILLFSPTQRLSVLFRNPPAAGNDEKVDGQRHVDVQPDPDDDGWRARRPGRLRGSE